jgi:hypothetical protein
MTITPARGRWPGRVFAIIGAATIGAHVAPSDSKSYRSLPLSPAVRAGLTQEDLSLFYFLASTHTRMNASHVHFIGAHVAPSAGISRPSLPFSPAVRARLTREDVFHFVFYGSTHTRFTASHAPFIGAHVAPSAGISRPSPPSSPAVRARRREKDKIYCLYASHAFSFSDYTFYGFRITRITRITRFTQATIAGRGNG